MTSSGGGTDEFQEKEDPFQTHCSLSAHVCCLPLSVHAALVIGNEFGFGTYVGYWKSQADTVAPPGYLMDFTQVRRANKCVYNTFHG